MKYRVDFIPFSETDDLSSDEKISYAVKYTLTKYREKYPNGFTTVYCYDTNKVLRAEGSISLLGNIKVKIK